MMKNIIVIICAYLAFVSYSFAETNKGTQAKAMMMGVFHFSSPGLDKVKVKHIDVMSKESQNDLIQLTKEISTKFKPTLILLEYSQTNDALIQKRYKQYLADNYTLPVNEIYQLGFRIAKQSGNVPIASFDDRGIGWEAEKLFKTMPSTAPETQQAFDLTIKNITKMMNAAHQTMTLRELLKQSNDPELDRQNKALYLLTNHVSTNDEFEGALAASSWWHRNFRMYAKIQQHTKAGERILVIGGQGHTAILKDFLAIDEKLDAVNINDFL